MSTSTYQMRTWDELKAETLARAERGAYPVFGISPDDARDALNQINDLDPDAWGAAWMALGDRHFARAQVEAAQSPNAAAQGYLTAWRLYTLGRWPVMHSPKKRECYTKAQAAFAAYGQFVAPRIEAISIPFEGKTIKAWLQKPTGVPRPPVTINIGGSDLWKDSVAIQTQAFLPHGIAALALDKPGTADSPVPARPGSERIVSAIIDHLLTRKDVDGTRVIVRGQSWGSYWSARAAYAERDRLKGAVFQSGPVHRYFQREWQEDAFKNTEFLFDYVPSRLHMLGVGTVEEAFTLMPSFSLLDDGLIDKPTPPMLLIGGAQDTQVPFSDFVLMLQHGSPKHAWVNPMGGTMGRSFTLRDDDITRDVVAPWLKQRFEG